MDEFSIHTFDVADAPESENLLRNSFDITLHQYIPYCQPGVARYLSTVAEHAWAYPQHQLLVASNAQGGMQAFAEFRDIDESTALLSYICVSAASRGRRLAEHLLREYAKRNPPTRKVALDVFAHNVAARKVYERLGFEESGMARWWSRPLSEVPPTAPPRALNWHTTIASSKLYGFSMLDVEWQGKMLTLGLPSTTVVRCPDTTRFDDDRLLGGLRSAVPTIEKALLIGPSGAESPPRGTRVLDSLRLIADTAAW